MGFKRAAVRLEWPTDHDLHGFEVLMRRPSVGLLEQLTGMDLNDDTPAEEQKEVVTRLAELLSSLLISWNYEIETVVNGEVIDQPVPANADGLRQLDVEMLFAIVARVQDTVSVPDAVGKGSSSGRHSPVQLPTMEILSPNLASSPPPGYTSQSLSAFLDTRSPH